MSIISFTEFMEVVFYISEKGEKFDLKHIAILVYLFHKIEMNPWSDNIEVNIESIMSEAQIYKRELFKLKWDELKNWEYIKCDSIINGKNKDLRVKINFNKIKNDYNAMETNKNNGKWIKRLRFFLVQKFPVNLK